MAQFFNREQVHKLPKAMDLGGVRQDDILVEVFTGAFSGVYTDATDVAVVTQLNQIIGGVVSPFDSYSAATDATYELSIEPVVTEDTNSHRKTFNVHRSSQGAVSGLKFSGMIWGRHFATD